MKRIPKIILFGFLIWLIPFLCGKIPYIAATIEALTGAVLTVIYFKKVKKNFVKEAAIIGGTWFGIVFLLDSLLYMIVIGIGGLEYAANIGIANTVIASFFLMHLNSLLIPIITLTVGYALQNKKKK